MINKQDKQRIDWIRREAITVFELTKGYTPEQREQMGNMLSTMEEMAGYVMELTGSLSATAKLERSEKLLKECREVIKELLPYAEMTEKWQSNYLIAEEIRSKVNRAKSIIETTSKPEKQ